MSSEELELKQIEKARLLKIEEAQKRQKYFEAVQQKKRDEEISRATEEYLSLIKQS